MVYIEEFEEGSMVGLPDGEKDSAFKKILGKYLNLGDPVSAVYLTGVEYNEKWLSDSLRLVCRNRRAFIGQNLFAEGACCKAISPEEERRDYVYLGEARMQVNIGLYALEDGKEKYISIIEAGGNWYETRGETDVLLDDTDTVEFIVSSISGDKKVTKSFSLPGLPGRPNKTTRIRITLIPTAVNRINVMMEDMGFGELFRRSGKIWNYSMDY